MATSLDEVLEAFTALLEERAQVPRDRDTDRSNFRCENCEGCSHCRFCTDCTDCEDCTYCTGCDECSGCTHCDDCQRCAQTTHSKWSSGCKDCSYVTLCLDCTSCVQCFACVGLRNEEFCILNEKLPRKTYFSRVAELRSAFERRVAEGWLPPWHEDLEELDDEPEPEPEAAPPSDEPAPPQPAAHFDGPTEPDQPRAPVEPDEPEPRAAATAEEPSAADSSAHLRLEALWASEMPDGSPVVDPGSGPIVYTPRNDANVDTIDTGEPEDMRRRQPTPMWSFDDVGRRRNPTREEPDLIPEPPPFGAPDEPRMSRSAPRMRPPADAPRERRREPSEPVRDRYGWSAQTEGTPASPGWTASALGPERQPAPAPPHDDSAPPSQRWDEPTVDRLPPRAPWDLERATSRSRWDTEPGDERPARPRWDGEPDRSRASSRRSAEPDDELPARPRWNAEPDDEPPARPRWNTEPDNELPARPQWNDDPDDERSAARSRWNAEPDDEGPPSRAHWSADSDDGRPARPRWDAEPEPERPSSNARWTARTEDTGATGRPAWDEPGEPPERPSPRNHWDEQESAKRPTPRPNWGQEETPHSLTRPRWDDQEPPPPEPRQRWDGQDSPPTKPRQRWSADPDLDRPASRLRWNADADADDDAQGQPEPRRHVPTPRVEAPPERGWSADPTSRDRDRDREPLPRWESSERDQETRPSKPRRDDDLSVRDWSLDKVPRTRSSARTSEVPAMPAMPSLSARPPAPAEPRREGWSPSTSSPSALDPRRRDSEVSLDHRRRETAASPSAQLRDADRPERGAGPITDFIQRDLDQWLPYDESRRPSLGPDEQTEPDAPVVRRGAARAEISSSARATSARSGSVEWPEDRRPGSRPHPKSSLGLARRPERPRNPEPRERGALLRGRAPTRPTAAPGPRQSDAPSLRHARRPTRSREETTSKFTAARSDGEPDPGSG